MLLPQSFITSMQHKLGVDGYIDFQKALNGDIPISIRINPYKYKTKVPDEAVAWYHRGYYLKERPVFTLDPAFHAGAYYVQEASSMYIGHIIETIIGTDKDIKILDLSAAPGGKSTLIANILQNKGLLVANEIIKNRAYTLKYNLSKEGFSNVIVTNNEPKDFTALTDFFDIILIDAPCSGEGMFRKDPKSISEWSPESVQSCSLRQQSIFKDVMPCLKTDGHLIYSTCTYNDAENIDNVVHLIQNHHLESLTLDVNPTWQISEITKKNAVGYQFFPHKTKGEGFFVAVLKKTDETNSKPKWNSNKNILQYVDNKSLSNIANWVTTDDKDVLMDKTGNLHLFPTEHTESAKILGYYLRLIYCGTTIGTLNKTVLIPDHSLALSLDKSKHLQTMELHKQDALLYLKKELPSIDSDMKSWILATYQGNGIGWLKNLGNRINNYLPSEYRILMALEE